MHVNLVTHNSLFVQDDMFGEVLGTTWPFDDIPPPVSKYINIDEDDDLVAPNGEGVFFPAGTSLVFWCE
jgi:hypothetical protein